jgi:hypothetical protein
MKNIYLKTLYPYLVIIFILGIISMITKTDLSSKNFYNSHYRYAGLSADQKEELKEVSPNGNKEESKTKVHSEDNEAKSNETSQTIREKNTIPPPSSSDLNRVEAVSIDRYAPVLFVFAIILIVYYARKSKKKNTP